MRIISLILVLILSKYCEGCMDEEREALLQIKSSINRGERSAFPTWYGEDCCNWEGVECNISTYRVIKLWFPPAEPSDDYTSDTWYPDATFFTQFEDLQELHFPQNRIGGFQSPNALDKLKHLKKLVLRDNEIANGSLPCWGNIPTLVHLDLSKNRLQGHIPQCICESQSLTQLILSYNQLEGNIGTCIGNMTSLKHLFLSHNQFSGKFPSLPFHNLTNIQSFVISDNNFTDVIPFSIFANLSELNYLDISFNPNLDVETESLTWSPSFSLKKLHLSNCNLNKRSGRKIPSFLSTQYHLESLDLSDNSLAGSFPSWLLYNISSEFWISGNHLSGSFPGSRRNLSSHLAILDISDNMLYGPFPEDINLIFPNLLLLRASQNMFNSFKPQSFGEMRQLKSLDLSMNNLQGEIALINLTSYSLQYLNLSNSHFEGKVHAGNFNLPNLRWLRLDRNGFTGSFPDSLSNLSTLQFLDIQHNDISGELSTSFPVLPQLRALILKGNRFKGSIPVQLCQMQGMQMLDLSENEFSGQIPTCLDNITSLKEEYTSNLFPFYSYGYPFIIDRLWTHDRESFLISTIDISSNKLTGTIPIQVTELRTILVLNMSLNLLTGQIPESFSNLEYLEVLDLSHNKLCGYLPDDLTSLHFLSSFDVSFNNLSGPLPEGGQFATFRSDGYRGNPNLCGPPLEKKCNLNLQPAPAPIEDFQGEINGKNSAEIIASLTLTLFVQFFFFVEVAF